MPTGEWPVTIVLGVANVERRERQPRAGLVGLQDPDPPNNGLPPSRETVRVEPDLLWGCPWYVCSLWIVTVLWAKAPPASASSLGACETGREVGAVSTWSAAGDRCRPRYRGWTVGQRSQQPCPA